MQPEELFGTLLPLGESWRVMAVTHQESERRFVIEIEESDQLWRHERCPRDEGKVRLYDHAPSRQWRHLNVFNHELKFPRFDGHPEHNRKDRKDAINETSIYRRVPA